MSRPDQSIIEGFFPREHLFRAQVLSQAVSHASCMPSSMRERTAGTKAEKPCLPENYPLFAPCYTSTGLRRRADIKIIE